MSVTVRSGAGYTSNRPALAGARLLTYPNPVRDAVSIVVDEPFGVAKAPAAQAADVQLFDAYGHRVRHTQATGLRFALDTHGLPDGFYNLVVQRGTEVLRRHIEISN